MIFFIIIYKKNPNENQNQNQKPKPKYITVYQGVLMSRKFIFICIDRCRFLGLDVDRIRYLLTEYLIGKV